MIMSPLENDPKNQQSFLSNLDNTINILAKTLKKEGK